MIREREIKIIDIEGMSCVYSMKNEVLSFLCVPVNKKESVLPGKLFREFLPQYSHLRPSSMIQAARKGDSLDRDLSAGTTLYDAQTAREMRPVSQRVKEQADTYEIVTVLSDTRGLEAKHVVGQVKGYCAAACQITYTNRSDGDIELDLASSFALSGLTPFEEENDPSNIYLHLLQNYWSGEARKTSVPLSHYNLEDSWSSLGTRIKKIGQVGTMPARAWLPFASIEDKKRKVTWAIQLEAPASWQIEIIHKNNALAIVAGIADRLGGHWRKILRPNESLKVPTVYFTAVNGGLDEACAALTDYQDTLLSIPKLEETLPVIYNEYLYTWGHPSMDKLRPQMKSAHEIGAEYFVVDAGWFCDKTDDELGEWRIDTSRFPGGLQALNNEIIRQGFKAGGVWFEFEGVTEKSRLAEKTDWLLHADGVPVRHGNRLLLDFRNEEVTSYLTEKVINALKDSGLRYVKIDYNENAGLGADGAESAGEGLRQHILQVQNFYNKLRREIPDLVIEICASGGMRHEPYFMTLGSMVSFSDAHEGPEGAVIAAQLHRFMQPRIMQVWACVKEEYSRCDIYFTMVKSMLGRIGLSGDLHGMKEAHRKIVKQGIEFYELLKPVIKSGTTVLIDTDEINSLRHLKGCIRLARKSKDGKYLACYGFGFNVPKKELFFDCDGYTLVAAYGDGESAKGVIKTSGARWSGSVMLLEKPPSKKKENN